MSAMDVERTERGTPLARSAGLAVGMLLFVLLLGWPSPPLWPDRWPLFVLPLDGPQRAVAATTALTASLWITVAIPIGAASLLPAVLFPMLGVLSAGQAAPKYMSDLVMLFIGAFIIALGLERWGVHRRMALWTISRVGTSKRGLVLGFMAAAAFLSLWINNTATTLLMLPIALAVLERVEGQSKEPSNFGLCLLLGIAYSASVGGMGTPVGTAPNQVFLGQFEGRFPDGPKLGFGIWFLGWVPLVVLFVPLGWLLMTRFVCPVRSGGGQGMDVIREERSKLGKMSRAEVMMSVVFAATAILWVTRSDIAIGSLRIPGWSRIFLGERAVDAAAYASNKKFISDSTVSGLMALACFLIPVDRARGVYLMDWRTASRLPWDVLLLLGSGFCIAEGFRVTELDRVLGGVLSPLFSGSSSWVLVAGVALFMSLLTEVTSNTATTAVLLPVVASAAVAAGVHPLLVMVPATIAASAAFMMPVATPPNAVVFSSHLVPVPKMLRAGIWFNVLLVVLVTVVFQLWVRPLWDIGSELPGWASFE
ncbi:MAG: SLC13/DASS family transporter [bacterium]|nr:SLC13/DASS family transporter [bacterium]